MIDYSFILTEFQNLPPEIKTALTACVGQLFKLVFKDSYDKIKNIISPDEFGVILTKSWLYLKDSYLQDAEKDSIEFNIFKNFFNNEAIINESLSKAKN